MLLRLGGRFGVFFCFSARGREEGESEAPGGGMGFVLKIAGGVPGGGGFQEGEGPRGREGVCSELGNLGGAG